MRDEMRQELIGSTLGADDAKMVIDEVHRKVEKMALRHHGAVDD